MTTDPIHTLRGMIERLERDEEHDAVVSGYLLALLDAGLVNVAQWQYYDSAIHRKLKGFGLPGDDPIHKLRGMIEQLERDEEHDAVAGGYLLALLDAGLVNVEQWQYYNSAIDRKLKGFGLPGFWNDKWLTDTNIDRFANLNKIIPGIESYNRDADSSQNS